MKSMIDYSRETGYNMGMEYCDAILYRVRCKPKQRRALGKPTSETQAIVNERNMKLNFKRVLHANFMEGRDLYVTLTFREGENPATRADAKRAADNFWRRVKRSWEKRGASVWEIRHNKGEKLPLKYLYVIEGGDGKRIHIHLAMTGGLAWQEIKVLWGMADEVNVKILQGSKNGMEALSKYLTKQGGLAKGEHHWYGSRNLSKPDYGERDNRISRETMEELADVIEDINAGKGEGVIPTDERYAPIEERYPGYYLAEAEAVYVEQFKEWVLHIQLYRQDTEAGRLEKRRRAAELRQIKARREKFEGL
jgi:hypothetical protein